MKLITHTELPTGLPPITHAQQLLLLGSCFAEHMGTQLSKHGFRADVNPFGILYNPRSVARALREIQAGRTYTEADLFHHHERWHSAMHHGDFSDASATTVTQQINQRLQQAHQKLASTDWLLLTWGTAYVYEQRSDGAVVANCHKLPESNFTRRCLTVDEIVTEYRDLLTELRAQTPQLNVLFTVSPIRHVRDGMHANQISKATLLLAIEALQSAFGESVFYFPSYEIMIDELRDYRFYADDMIHPSALAVRYIWERFESTFFSQETQTIMQECESIRKALAHKPFHSGSEAHKIFLKQIVLKINQLNQKYPYLDFEKEPK